MLIRRHGEEALHGHGALTSSLQFLLVPEAGTQFHPSPPPLCSLLLIFVFGVFFWQVEERLNSERSHELTIPSSGEFPRETTRSRTSMAESQSTLGSPLYLLSDPNPNPSTAFQDSSEPPQAFLSPSSPQFPPSPRRNPSPTTDPPGDPSNSSLESRTDDLDDIGRLIRLLGLSDLGVEDREKGAGRDLTEACGGGGGNPCECRGGFYEKIVGVKGPKCRIEEERLNGWIEHFFNGSGSESIEPLRLAHLLLGRAALTCGNVDFGSRGILEFPGTVEEFLQNDPPH